MEIFELDSFFVYHGVLQINRYAFDLHLSPLFLLNEYIEAKFELDRYILEHTIILEIKLTFNNADMLYSTTH